jgi:hypothetical protein
MGVCPQFIYLFIYLFSPVSLCVGFPMSHFDWPIHPQKKKKTKQNPKILKASSK